nr:pentatricopeptide repeat-containing protein At2g22070 [Ipomoea batatas]
MKPDHYTLASVLSACSNLEELNVGKQIHSHILRTEFDYSGAVGNALISMYSQCGAVEIARKIFDSLKDRDVVAWTAMIVGYMQNGLNNDAMDLFRLMSEIGPEPNKLYSSSYAQCLLELSIFESWQTNPCCSFKIRGSIISFCK